MATRLYTNRDWYMDWLTQILTLKGGWDSGGSAPSRIHFSPVKENSNTATRGVSSSVTFPYKRPLMIGITPRLTAQTISGTVNPMLFLTELDAAWNCFLRLHLYVTVGDTDAVRGTLLTYEDTVNEFDATAYVAQQLGAAQTLTPVAALDGDRIGIEIGFIQRGAGSGSFVIGSALASAYTKGDATVGSTTPTGSSALNQFIEFSATLSFKPGLANETCAGATVVSTFPYTTTVDTTNSATVNQPNYVGNCSNWGDDSLPVWWKITVAAGATLTIHTGGSAYPTIVSLWTGSCAGLTHRACADGPTSGAPLVYGPTTGVDYYLLVNRDIYDDGINAISGPGGLVSVSISTAVAAPHGCTEAVPITAIPTTITGLDTTARPTESAPILSCVGAAFQKHMQWFSYVPATSHLLYLTAAGTTYDHGIAVYTGACPAGPWTQYACRWGSVATPARVSVAVTAGTPYWIVVAADDNAAGLLSLFVGDTTALGFIQPGSRGAVEWAGNHAYHQCTGEPCFLQILSPTGGQLLSLRTFQVGSCAVGSTWMIDVLKMVGVANGTHLPAIPTVPFGPTGIPGCGSVPYDGHYDAAQSPPTTDFGDGYNGSFKLRFRLSSLDTVSGALVNDAYLEVVWPGSSFGTYRWENLLINGSTWDGSFSFHPGWWTDRIYVRAIDEYCGWNPLASDLLWYRDFRATPATPAELYTELGGLFHRVTQYCGAINDPSDGDWPRISNGTELATYWPDSGLVAGLPTYISVASGTVCSAAFRRVGPFPPFIPPTPPPPPCVDPVGNVWPIDDDTRAAITAARRRR